MSIYAQVTGLTLSNSEAGVKVTFKAPAVSGFVSSPAVAEVVVCAGTTLGPVNLGYPVYLTDVLPGSTSVVPLPGLVAQQAYTVAVRFCTSAHESAGVWVTQVFTCPPALAVLPYINPFAAATILAYERVDQGVDFAGTGPVLALGNGVITETNGPGWPGGPYMTYKLSDGPAAGLYVYMAEDLTVGIAGDTLQKIDYKIRAAHGRLSLAVASTLAIGQKITAGQVIANMYNGANGIEIGWGRTTDGLVPESQTAACGSITGSNLPAGGTMIGRNFSELLRVLGVKIPNNLNDVPGGSMPAGWPTWTP